VSTGGVVATADLAQTGVIAQEVLQRFFATRTIIGTGGVSKIGGLTEFDQSVADLNRVMVERSEEVMVLVDPSKSGVTANFRVAGIEVVEEFITSNEGRKILEKELGSIREGAHSKYVTFLYITHVMICASRKVHKYGNCA